MADRLEELAQRYYEMRKYPSERPWTALLDREKGLFYEVVGQVCELAGIDALRGALRQLYDTSGDVLDDFDDDESGASFWRTVEAMAAARVRAAELLDGQK